MQEILNNNLPQNYHNEATSKEYNINELRFLKTIDRLEVEKPVLKLATAAAKEINNLKEKVNGNKDTCKRTYQ